MNAPGGFFNSLYKKYEDVLGWNFEYTGIVASTETLQVDDYSKYHMAVFNVAERKQRRENVFQDGCRKAFDFLCIGEQSLVY